MPQSGRVIMFKVAISKRCRAFLPILLSAAGPAAFGQTYDPRTGIAELPGNPVAPTSYTQCDTLQRQWSQLSKALEDAHEKCLEAHHKEPEDPRASFTPSNPVCSHFECQKLHTARIEIGQKSKERVDACRAEVAQFQKKQQIARQEMQSIKDRQQAEQEQQSALQREIQARKAAAERQQEQRAEEALQLEQKRREASEQIAQTLANNVDSIEQALRRKQQLEAAQNAPLTGDGEFAGVLPAPPDTVQQEDLSVSRLTKQGDPPDTITDRWKAGQSNWRADGFFDRELYTWQFYVTDTDLCPAIQEGETNILRGALYQETAIAHIQVVNHTIVRSNIEKRRNFLRCIRPSEMNGYPKYRPAPVDLPKIPSATMGCRG